MIRYFTLLLFTALAAHADLHFARPVVPPKAEDVVSFANGPSFDFRVPRERFIAFLRSAHAYTVLPPDLQKRGEAGELGFVTEIPDGKGGKEKAEALFDLHGVFTDKKGTVFFWQAIGPRLLVISTEDGYGCYFYLEEKEGANQTLEPTRTGSGTSAKL